jgi:hypothetical protein
MYVDDKEPDGGACNLSLIVAHIIFHAATRYTHTQAPSFIQDLISSHVMKLTSAVWGVVVLATSALGGRTMSSLFEQDVSRSVHGKKNRVRARQQNEQAINQQLLSIAIPLADYQAALKSHGQYIDAVARERRMNADNQDDFFLDDDAMYSFSGFSIKYTQCQSVKYFSEDAITAGEHSPMLTQDIVILRLCPQKTCSATSQYGCHYNYAEYAVALKDYLDIMLRFSGKKRDAVCGWCDECYNNQRRRKLEQGQAEDGAEDKGEANEEQQQAQEEEQAKEEENQAEEEAAAAAANDDAAASYAGDCSNWSTYCTNYNSVCNDDGKDDSSAYVSYEEYMDYLDCAQVKYNDYAYFVRPRCNGASIEMAVYYDNFCSQRASEVNVRNVGLGFHEGFFQDYYSGECMDCSESVRICACF